MAAEKRKGAKSTISESIGIAVRHVRKLQAGFMNAPTIVFPYAMGRPRRGTPARGEQQAPLAAPSNPGQAERGAASEGQTRSFPRASYTPCSGSPAARCRTKEGRGAASGHGTGAGTPTPCGMRTARSWTAGAGGWQYEDGASRFIAGRGAFGEAAAWHAVEAPGRAISQYGKPIVSDRGSKLYATQPEKRGKGVSGFGKRLEESGIRHVPAGAAHPQTSGKPERMDE